MEEHGRNASVDFFLRSHWSLWGRAAVPNLLARRRGSQLRRSGRQRDVRILSSCVASCSLLSFAPLLFFFWSWQHLSLGRKICGFCSGLCGIVLVFSIFLTENEDLDVFDEVKTSAMRVFFLVSSIMFIVVLFFISRHFSLRREI